MSNSPGQLPVEPAVASQGAVGIDNLTGPLGEKNSPPLPDWESEDGRVQLYCADCLDMLPRLDKVDAVVTDPPYSQRTHEGHDNGARPGNDGAARKALGYSALSERDVFSVAAAFANACSGWIVWMCDHHLAPHIQHALEAERRYVFAPLPFYAPGSRVRLCGDGPSSWTIWIVVARTAAQSRWGTLPGGYVAGDGWRERSHMGGKPTALMECLIRDYSRTGDLVLDPFMGSGTTGVAAVKLKRRFIGIEIDRGYFEVAKERIQRAIEDSRTLWDDLPDAMPEQQEIDA